jgi:cell division protein FtsZ
MKVAEAGIAEMKKAVDTLIIIPNQNLFRVASERTTFVDAFGMADQVLCSGVACITDLMVKEGLVNLDFADVCSVMYEMGSAMIGTGQATGEGRARRAAEAAIANPLLDETSMRGARGLLVAITGSRDLTLYELDEAASRIRQEVDDEANIIVGATFDGALGDAVRVSVVATGVDRAAETEPAVWQSRAGPTLQSSLEASSIASDAYPLTERHAHPAAADVIPFPEPDERRTADEQDAHENRQPPRHSSLLKRLGVTVPESWPGRRASGSR